MVNIKQALDGKFLPWHLKVFRDEDTGRIELRYWRFQPFLIFLIPFMSVWSGLSIFGYYVLPFLKHASHPAPADYLPLVFGIPFLLVSAVVWCGILLMLFGTRRLVLESGRGVYSVKLWGGADARGRSSFATIRKSKTGDWCASRNFNSTCRSMPAVRLYGKSA